MQFVRFFGAAIVLFFSSFIFAAEEVKPLPKTNEEKIMNGGVLFFDAAPPFRDWFREIRKSDPDNLRSASCGHINAFAVHRRTSYSVHYAYNPNFLGSGTTFQCAYSVIGFDFKKREVLVFIDMEALKGNDYFLNETKTESVPIARYFAGVSGEPTDFFGDIHELEKNGDKKIDTLAEAIQALSFARQKFAQKYYTDGKLSLRARGAMKFDPHRKGMTFPSDANGTLALTMSENSNPIGVVMNSSPSNSNPGVHSIREGFDKLKVTIGTLRDGYSKLKINSDSENRDVFRQHLRVQAPKMAEEFGGLMKMLQSNKFYIVELVYLVNTLSDLADSIDQILKDELGKGPDFMTTINESQK